MRRRSSTVTYPRSRVTPTSAYQSVGDRDPTDGDEQQVGRDDPAVLEGDGDLAAVVDGAGDAYAGADLDPAAAEGALDGGADSRGPPVGAAGREPRRR